MLQRSLIQAIFQVSVIFGRRPSSLPKWIPSELRRGPLVKSVMQHINDGTLPVRAAENQLYRVITNQMKGKAQRQQEQESQELKRK